MTGDVELASTPSGPTSSQSQLGGQRSNSYKSKSGFGIRKKLGLVEEDDKYKSKSGLGIRKKLGIQPKNAEERRREQASKQEQQKRQQEEQERRDMAKARKLEGMLPWNFETKLACVLGLVKMPLIILVAVIGVYSENHLKDLSQESWLRSGSFEFGGRASCYAHEVQDPVKHKEVFGFDLTAMINRSIFFGRLKGDVFTSNVTFDPFGSVLGARDTCNIDLNTCKIQDLQKPSYFAGGIDHFVPFALIWFVYKILFIGVHPIDRLALKIAGDPDPGPDYPEPLMKLLTEPYFQCCTTPMAILVKVLGYFRYRMAPNALLGALATMRDMSPKCPTIIYYKMDPKFGTAVYFMCIVDLLCIGGGYILALRVMNGSLIGRWRYRLWKFIWVGSSILVANYAIFAAFLTFGGIISILRGFGRAFMIVFKLSFKIHLSLDILRVMTFIIMFFEGVELAFLIINILFPHFFERFGAADTDDESESEASAAPAPPGGRYDALPEGGRTDDDED